jgi:microcystin-dependent protein
MSSEPFLATIAMFAGNFAPRGWALCNGQILPIAQNTALFSLLGTTFGGNGQTTFALPDLRGRAPVGAGPGPGLSDIALGEAAGSESVTLTSSNMPIHNHLVNCDPTGSSSLIPTGNVPGLSDERAASVPIYSAAAPTTTMNPLMIGNAGQSQPFGIRNPYLGINFIIALEGIFPSRN